MLLRSIALLGLLFTFACAPIKHSAANRLTAEDAPALDAKLGRQFERYEAAQKFLVTEVAELGHTITREQWESLLAPTDAPWTADDIAQLRQRHQELAVASQQRARERSLLDLDHLRQAKKVREFCADLPKGGLLHVHPWGTLDRDYARRVLEQVNPVVPFDKLKLTLNAPGATGTLYPDELARLDQIAHQFTGGTRFKDLAPADQEAIVNLFFLPPGNHAFDRFTAVFTAISALVFANPAVDPEALQWDGFLRRAQQHHVRYVEVSRFIIPKAAWINGLEAWAKTMEDTYGVTVRFHAAFARNKPLEFTKTKTDQLLALPESPILNGIDFLADETAYPALEYGQGLYAAVLHANQTGKSRLHRTAHAGELGDPRNVRDMMIMGVERLGHGVKLQDDPVALEYARRQALPVEVNLISNLRLKVVDSIAQHPFLHFLRLGLRVSLSTDDEGIFESTIDDECTTAITATDVSYDELKTMSYNAITTSFADDATKARLQQLLDEDFAAFEATWKPRLANTVH